MNQTFRKLRDNRIDLEKRLQDAIGSISVLQIGCRR